MLSTSSYQLNASLVFCFGPDVSFNAETKASVQPVLFFSSFSVIHAADFSEVESDFHAKVPAVFCRDVSR